MNLFFGKRANYMTLGLQGTRSAKSLGLGLATTITLIEIHEEKVLALSSLLAGEMITWNWAFRVQDQLSFPGPRPDNSHNQK
jgi:hypothetical protein